MLTPSTALATMAERGGVLCDFRQRDRLRYFAGTHYSPSHLRTRADTGRHLDRGC